MGRGAMRMEIARGSGHHATYLPDADGAQGRIGKVSHADRHIDTFVHKVYHAITPRFTEQEVSEYVAALTAEVNTLRAELSRTTKARSEAG